MRYSQLLRQALKTQPLNHYSAIDKAVEVALGSNAAVFADNTKHDIIPSLAITHFAGGVAFADGKPIDVDNLPDEFPAGIIYTNRLGSIAFMQALQTGETSGFRDIPCVAN